MQSNLDLTIQQGIGTLEDVIEQSRSVINQIETSSCFQNSDYDGSRNGTHLTKYSSSMATLEYLQAYLDALSATLSVLLQSLQTAQSLMWRK